MSTQPLAISALRRSMPIFVIAALFIVTLATPAIAQKIYWTDGGAIASIERANLDGSAEEILVEPVLEEGPGGTGLALDSINGVMYWIGFGTIVRADLNGANRATILDTLGIGETPVSLALGPSGNTIYWTYSSLAARGIKRAGVNGANIQDLANSAVVEEFFNPDSIALDVDSGKMYWVEHGLSIGGDQIMRGNLDGSEIEVVVPAVKGDGTVLVPGDIASITLDTAGRMVYWIDTGIRPSATTSTEIPPAIRRANLDALTEEDLVVDDLVTQGLLNPNDLALNLGDGMIYWTEGTALPVGGRIRRAPIGSNQIEDVVVTTDDMVQQSMFRSPVSIALDLSGGSGFPGIDPCPFPATGNTTAAQKNQVPQIEPCPTTGVDLVIEQDVDPLRVLVREGLTVTISVTNQGTTAATNVVVTSTVPSGEEFIVAEPSQGVCDLGSDPVICRLGTIKTADAAAIKILALAPSRSGVITHVGTVTAAEPDRNPEDNSVSLDIRVRKREADLSISMTASEEPATTIRPLTYTISVVNNGPDDATGVEVIDTLPDGVEFLSATTSQGTCSTANPGSCLLGTLARNANVTITMTVFPRTATDALINRVKVKRIEKDPKKSNNKAELTTVVEERTAIALLAVRLTGSGDGSVTSTPPGIDCPSTCAGLFPRATTVTLTATPKIGSTFDGWSGDSCIGTENPCEVNFVQSFHGTTGVFQADDGLSGPGPDLTGTIRKLKHKAGTSTKPNKLTVVVEVLNRGTVTPDTPVFVTLDLSMDGTRSEERLGITAIDPAMLVPGLRTSVTFKITDHPGPLGSQFALVTIDDGDFIDESDEENNVLVQRIGGRGCARDLVVQEQPRSDPNLPQQIGSMGAKQCLSIKGTFDGRDLDGDGTIDADLYRVNIKKSQLLDVNLRSDGITFYAVSFFEANQKKPVAVCLSGSGCPNGFVHFSESATLIDIQVRPLIGKGAYTIDLAPTLDCSRKVPFPLNLRCKEFGF